MYGGEGDDSISGAGNNNDAYRFFGGAGNDLMTGGTNADILSGGDGADSLSGADGADTLFGGGGADRLVGGTGVDLMYGGDGNDSLVAAGSLGDRDVMFGGDGADRFVFGVVDTGAGLASTQLSAQSVNAVADFVRGTDKIQLLTGIFIASGATAGISNSATFAGNNTITYQSDGADLIVRLQGNANNYLIVKLTGVSAVDINDFEFL